MAHLQRPLITQGESVGVDTECGQLAPPLHTPAGTRFLFETALRSDVLFRGATTFAGGTMIRAILATPEVVETTPADERLRVQRMLEQILPVSPRRFGLLNDAAVTSSLPRYDLERIAAHRCGR